jgi:hypothetical protein
MKVILIVIAVMLIGAASAERENVKVNNFDVSFELNKTHDYKIDTNDGINGSILIRTLDNPIEISLVKYQKDLDAAKQLNNSRASDIMVDGLTGKNFLIVTEQGNSFYGVEYYPDLKDGKARTYALIAIGTGLDIFTAVDFLKSLHIGVGK